MLFPVSFQGSVRSPGQRCREQAMEALRILRALVRGFVLHEMSQSFLEDVDYDESYSAAVDVFIRGLDVMYFGPLK
jgi:uncharacterized protein (DUF2342 family)